MKKVKFLSLTGTCTFDNNDLCSWKNVNGTDFNWLLKSGPTPTVSTGPNNDHTLGTSKGIISHFLFLILFSGQFYSRFLI